MHDSIAAWMIAGGIHAETSDRTMSHLVAIREACAAADAGKPGLFDRIRAMVRTEDTAPSIDCCGA